jgi:hypothetical protein
VHRTTIALAVVGAFVAYTGGELWKQLRPSVEARTGITSHAPGEKKRAAALARAKVFRNEPFNPAAIDFTRDPNAGVLDTNFTSCRFDPDDISGTSPKFDCRLENGTVVKVKYGWTREIPSEVAATRLLHALGFGADRVSLVEVVRCYGCPFQPFHTRSLEQVLKVNAFFDKHLDYTGWREFRKVSAERKIDGKSVETDEVEGWSFYELKQIDSSIGGATRGEVDALRLMAMFLNHWDNKSPNQRLVCVGADSDDCDHPLAMIQDAGSHFGPKKVRVENWRSTPIWADAPGCTISMKSLPYGGGTFEDVQISEDGRRLLGNRLRALSAAQIHDLFESAGLDDLSRWTEAFQDKVRQIVDRQPCPSAPTTKLSS